MHMHDHMHTRAHHAHDTVPRPLTYTPVYTHTTPPRLLQVQGRLGHYESGDVGIGGRGSGGGGSVSPRGGPSPAAAPPPHYDVVPAPAYTATPYGGPGGAGPVAITPPANQPQITLGLTLRTQGRQNQGLGINIKGAAGAVGGQGAGGQGSGGQGGIYIASIVPGSLADEDKRLRPNDRLLKVNRQELTGLTNDQAVQVLRRALAQGDVSFTIARNTAAAVTPGSSSYYTGTQPSFASASPTPAHGSGRFSRGNSDSYAPPQSPYSPGGGGGGLLFVPGLDSDATLSGSPMMSHHGSVSGSQPGTSRDDPPECL